MLSAKLVLFTNDDTIPGRFFFFLLFFLIYVVLTLVLQYLCSIAICLISFANSLPDGSCEVCPPRRLWRSSAQPHFLPHCDAMIIPRCFPLMNFAFPFCFLPNQKFHLSFHFATNEAQMRSSRRRSSWMIGVRNATGKVPIHSPGSPPNPFISIPKR